MEANEIIKNKLNTLGIKQKKIAEILGESESLVSHKMKGYIPFSVVEVKTIADFLNVKVDDLIGGASHANGGRPNA